MSNPPLSALRGIQLQVHVMIRIEQSERRELQTHHRLAELELVIVIDVEPSLAGPIAQAARSGASSAQVVDAFNQGIEMRGASTPVLRQYAMETIGRGFGVRSGSLAPRRPGLGLLSV